MPAHNNHRIASNTLMLYLRMLLTVGVSLYAVRIVLHTLGAEDYGIYSVVGGIVALLSFLPGSMASATQRFFSFSIGQGDLEKLKAAFTVNWIVYVAIGLIALLMLETAGQWFVSGYLKIPADRTSVAVALYRLSIWTFASGILTAPFQAIITAHEDMHVYAFISIFEAFSKLAAVLLLTQAPGDKLFAYGSLMLAVSVLVTCVYIIVCLRRYPECQFRHFYWDGALVREIIGFTGWTLFGQLSTVFRTQAVTVLLNQFFNPVVVASRAIAMNVATQANLLSGNFNTSLYPPIIKTYAAGDHEGMYSLVFNGSKITFFLMWILALPLFMQMDTVLGLWLNNPPPEAALFARLALVESMITAVSLPLMTAARAPGRMARYETVLGIIQVAIFFVSWLMLKGGAPAYSVFVVAIVANGVMFAVRLFIVQGLVGLSAGSFVRKVAGPVIGVSLISLTISQVLVHFLPSSLLFSIISTTCSSVASLVCIYYIGLDLSLRVKIVETIKAKVAQLA